MKFNKLILKKIAFFALISILFIGTINLSFNTPTNNASLRSNPQSSQGHLLWTSKLSGTIRSIAISDAGDYIACGNLGYVSLFNKSSNIALWNYSTGSTVNEIDISADGKYILAGCQDGWVYLFNNSVTTPKQYEWRYDTSEAVWCVAISADGKYAVAGTSGTNDKVCLLNVSKTSDPHIWTNSDSSDGIESVSISGNGSYIAASAFVYLYKFNLSSSTPDWSATLALGGIVDIKMSRDGNYIAVVSSGYVNLFDKEFTSDTYLWQDDSLNGYGNSVDITLDGSYIVVAGDNAFCALYNKTGSTPEREYSVDALDHVNDAAISLDGNYVAAGYTYITDSYRNTTYFYDRDSSIATWRHMSQTTISHVALSANGSYLAACDWDDNLYFYDTLKEVPESDDYNLGFSKGDTFLYEITVKNNTELSALGITFAADSTIGEKRCYKITNIEETSSYWLVSYDAWDWSSDNDGCCGITIYEDEIIVYKDPLDYGYNIKYIHPDLISILPKPTEEYIGLIDWDSSITVSGCNITWDAITYEVIYNYDDEGFLDKYTVKKDTKVILEIKYAGKASCPEIQGQENEMPDLFVMILFIGIVAGVGIVGIIMMKKHHRG